MTARAQKERKPKLSNKLVGLIRHAVGVHGTCDPTAIYYLFEEKLTEKEDDVAWPLLNWAFNNGRVIGDNIQEVYAEYAALSLDEQRPYRRPAEAATSDPAVSRYFIEVSPPVVGLQNNRHRVVIDPPQVFYCDRCGLFNPLDHLRAGDLRALKLDLLPVGQIKKIQLQAAECPNCGAFISPMSQADVDAIIEMFKK